MNITQKMIDTARAESRAQHDEQQAEFGGIAFAQTYGRQPTHAEIATWEGGAHVGREDLVIRGAYRTLYTCSAPLAPLASDFVIVHLRGGSAENADDAVCVDLDRGLTRGEEWSALVAKERLDVFLHNSGAEQLGEPEPWDGSRFGDGNGTVEIVDGEIEGTGLYDNALPEPRLCGEPATTTRELAADDDGGRITAHLCAAHAARYDEEQAQEAA